MNTADNREEGITSDNIRVKKLPKGIWIGKQVSSQNQWYHKAMQRRTTTTP
jgi:hypothetical protein